MKKIIICFIVITAFLHCSVLQAQIMTVGAGAEFMIKSGTTVSFDSLELTPSANYSFSNNTLSKSNAVSNSTTFNYINKVYQYSATTAAYSGALKLFYNNSQLNGRTASGLKLLVNNGTSWSLDNNSSSITASNVVLNNSLSGVSLREITAADCINPTSGGTIAASQSGSSGFNPAAFTSSAAPTGHNGILEYKWQSSTTSSSAGFSDIASSNSATYDVGALTQTTWFKRLAKVDCSSDWSGAAESNVLQICITPADPSASNNSRCSSGTVTISATPGSGETIDWYDAASGGTLLSTGSSFTTPSISSTTTYYAEARNSSTNCVSANRTAVTATVNALPATPSGTNGTRCSTGTVSISATPGSGETIDWYDVSSGGSVLTNGSGVTSFTTPSISTTTIYYAEARNTTTGCVSATRRSVTATVDAQVTTATAGADQALCNTSTFTLNGNSPSSGTGAWSFVGSSGGASITNSSSQSSTVTSVTTNTDITLRWTVTNGTCSSIDDVVIRNDAQPSSVVNINVIVTGNCSGNTGPFTNTGLLNGYYHFQKGNTHISFDGTKWFLYEYTPSNNAFMNNSTSNGLYPPTTGWVPTACTGTLTWSYASAVASYAGADQALCNTSTFTLAGNEPSSGTGVWSFVGSSGSASITNSSLRTSTVTSVPANTDITLRWTTTNGACSSTDDVVIRNIVPAAPSAGNNSRCSTGSVSISATPGSGEVIDWYESLTSITPILSASNTYTTPNLSSTTNYYAIARDLTTGCLSAPPGNNNSLYFDGSNDFVSSTVNPTSSFTIETWARAFGNLSGFHMIGAKWMSIECLEVSVLDSKPRMVIQTTTGFPTLVGSTSLAVGQWYHLAYTFDGSYIKLYVNGVLDGSLAVTGTIINNTQTFKIGATRNGTSSSYNWSGNLDNYRIWNVARSAADILADMNRNLTTGNGLMAAFDFNQGEGSGNNTGTTTLIDITGNGYDGTITNFALTGNTSNFVADVDNITGNTRTAVTATINPLPSSTITAGGATTFNYGGSVELSAPTAVLSQGNALSFNGTSNYVSIPSGINTSNFSGNQITVEGWFYATQSFPATVLIGEAFEGDGVIKFALYSNNVGGAQKIIAGFYSSTWVQPQSSTDLPFNQWTHIAATYDQANIKIYVNGVLTCTQANTSALPGGNERWLLGKCWDCSNFFPGKMDEVRIWNVARTQTQIQNSMSGTISPTTSGLVGYYKLDESSGTTATDATGHGYDGTVN